MKIWKWGIILAGIIVLLIAIWILLAKGSFYKIMPPAPVVVSCDYRDTSSFGDFKITVSGQIRNDGGDGDVIIIFGYREGDNDLKKTVRRFFTANETAKVEMEFAEATLFGKGVYSVEVK